MSSFARKWVWVVLRVAVCTAALAYVLNGVTWYDHVTLDNGDRLRVSAIDEDGGTVTAAYRDGHQAVVSIEDVAVDASGRRRLEYGLRSAWQQCRKSVLVLALLVFAPVTFLQSLRFLLVFNAQGIPLSYWECVKLSFAGNFLNWATPIGTTGGDVFKAYHLARHTPHKTEALTTILLDRIMGLGALLACVGAAIEVGATDPLLRSVGHVIVISIGLGIGLMIVVFSERIRDRLVPAGWLARLPLADQLRRADAATRRLLANLPSLSGAVCCALVLQFAALSSFVLAAYALQMDFAESRVFDYYASIGAGNVVAAIPIAPQGLGTTEAVYRKFMLGTHGSLSQLLCMAMAVRAIHLCWSLPGALVALTGAYKLRPALGTG